MKLSIKTLTGEYAIASQEGEALFNLLYPMLKVRQSVDLDFSGVRVFASPFFNASLGRLLSEFKLKDLEDCVEYSNLAGVGVTVLKKVLKNANEYYSNPKAREAIDEMLKESEDDAEPPNTRKGH